MFSKPINTSTADFVEFYDELPLWSAPFGAQLLTRVPMRPDQRMLDIGTGTGFMAIECAQRCGTSCQVTALDVWQPALDRLQAKLQHLGLTNVELLAGDAATVELRKDYYDVAISNLGINNFENPAAVLRNIATACNDKGTLLMSTNLSGHMQEFYDVFETTLHEINDAESLARLQAHTHQRGTVESVTELLHSGGFHVDDVIQTSFKLRFTNATALFNHYHIRYAFLPSWRALVADETAAETFDLLKRNLDAQVANQSGFELTIPNVLFVATKVPSQNNQNI